MLAGSAAAAATPLLTVGTGWARAATAATPATVSFSIKNNTGSNTVYAFVTWTGDQQRQRADAA